jgi:transposase-like protein
MDLGDVILGLFASGCSVRNISGFIETVYGAYYSPASISRLTDISTQACVLHTVQGSLKKVRKRDREAVAESFKAIYRASSREEARKALLELKAQWTKTYPEVVKRWEENFNKG